jgi:hypothetical protein
VLVLTACASRSLPSRNPPAIRGLTAVSSQDNYIRQLTCAFKYDMMKLDFGHFSQPICHL